MGLSKPLAFVRKITDALSRKLTECFFTTPLAGGECFYNVWSDDAYNVWSTDEFNCWNG